MLWIFVFSALRASLVDLVVPVSGGSNDRIFPHHLRVVQGDDVEIAH